MIIKHKNLWIPRLRPENKLQIVIKDEKFGNIIIKSIIVCNFLFQLKTIQITVLKRITKTLLEEIILIDPQSYVL